MSVITGISSPSLPLLVDAGTPSPFTPLRKFPLLFPSPAAAAAASAAWYLAFFASHRGSEPFTWS